MEMDDRPVCCLKKLVDQYLPDEVICNILSRLPMKNAVQAGLLSKKWKDHWTFNPNLVLDLYSQKPTDVVRIINHCIASYKGKHLRTFRLIAFPSEDITKEVTKWVDFAVGKQVSVLDIAGLAMVRHCCESPCSYFDPPESLFSCDSIESLSLNSCIFIPPLGFKGFSSLKALYLRNSRIREETVGQVLSKCPLLETFKLYEPESSTGFLKICCPPSPQLSYIRVDGNHVKGIEISAPGLQFLDLTGNPETLLVSAPRLVKAQLTTWLSVRGSGDLTVEALRDWASTIAQFSDVLALTVNMHFLMLLYADCYMNERNPRIKFEYLKVFHVLGDLDETYGVSALVNFFRDCPSIRSLIIGPRPRHGPANWVCEYMKMEQVRPIILTDKEEEVEMLGGDGVVGSTAAAAAEDFSDYDDLVHLKSITMLGFSGNATEMKLVKFLLQKAVALDILDLQWEPFCYSPTVIRELAPLAAKSSHAEIKELRCVEKRIVIGRDEGTSMCCIEN